jgi:hypothetical protein
LSVESGTGIVVGLRKGEVHLVGDLVPSQIVKPLVVRDPKVRRQHCSSSTRADSTTVAASMVCQADRAVLPLGQLTTLIKLPPDPKAQRQDRANAPGIHPIVNRYVDADVGPRNEVLT